MSSRTSAETWIGDELRGDRQEPIHLQAPQTVLNQTPNYGKSMTDPIKIENRGDFGLWAVEAAKQIVGEQGFQLAKAARDGSEDELRIAGNALGQAITNALLEVYDGLLEVGED